MSQSPPQKSDEPTKKYVPLNYHQSVIQDLMKKQEEETRQLKEALTGAEGAIAAKSQELYFLRNVYPDLSNIHKGQAQFMPDSFKNSMRIVKGLWQQYKHPWLMFERTQQRKRRPLWHYVVAVTIPVFVISAAFSPGIQAAIAANTGAIVVALAVVGLILFLQRRRREKPQL